MCPHTHGHQASGLDVYGFDFNAHGFSSCTAAWQAKGARRGLFHVQDVVDEAVQLAKFVQFERPGVPMFLLATSFGGMVAIHTSVQLPALRGLVLLCPFVVPDPDSVPPAVMVKALQCVSWASPSRLVVPMSPSPHKHLNERYLNDPHCYSGLKDGLSHLRARVAIQLRNWLIATEAALPNVRAPLLVFQGAADTLSAPVGANALYHNTNSPCVCLRYRGLCTLAADARGFHVLVAQGPHCAVDGRYAPQHAVGAGVQGRYAAHSDLG